MLTRTITEILDFKAMKPGRTMRQLLVAGAQTMSFLSACQCNYATNYPLYLFVNIFSHCWYRHICWTLPHHHKSAMMAKSLPLTVPWDTWTLRHLEASSWLSLPETIRRVLCGELPSSLSSTWWTWLTTYLPIYWGRISRLTHGTQLPTWLEDQGEYMWNMTSDQKRKWTFHEVPGSCHQINITLVVVETWGVNQWT